ncbi:uncharacterized protein TNCV_991681 [Trichonephila clavipes]|nr:uncharacterized protein TNCV_991681 [Trichonephila clavipes]
MDLFLTLFEQQMKLLDLGEDPWVPYLIGTLPSDVTSLIARYPEEKCRDFSHIRGMLLQRFKLTAEKFRELFSRHRKSPNGTWKDFYFEIRAYFEGWLNELKIDSFDGLKNLMIADQMKKSCSPERKEHYLDIWEELISPEMLADKLEALDNIRRSLPRGPGDTCYGCGKQVVIKSRCPTCNLNASQRTDVATNHINAYTAQTRSPRLTLIDITFCGIKGRVCSDQGSSHSIAGERMFQIFKDKGLLFQETTLAMSLVDGQQTTDEALTTQFCWFGSRCEEYTCWYFWDNPTHKYPFGEELDPPSIVKKMSSNTCQLREGEGESLTSVCVCAQKEKLNLLLESFQNVFEPGGEATNILEHHINSGTNPPISVPPYRMSPTPVPAQHFQTLAIDLFGPLPESKDGKRWILIIEDCTTKWVELFALSNATAKECAITLIEEVLLRAKCETTGQTAAFLNFGRDLRSPSEVVNDIRVVIQNDNFVPEITSYLKKFAKFSTQIREVVEEQQDSRKFYADKKRKAAPTYQPGEHVFVASHPLSNAAQGVKCKTNVTQRRSLRDFNTKITIILRDC